MKTAELFDVDEHVFLPLINLKENRVLHSLTLLSDKSVFIYSNGSGELLTIIGDKKSQYRKISHPEIRDSHSANVLGNGNILIVGGVYLNIRRNY